MSDVRSSSPLSEPDTPSQGRIVPAIDSRRNTVIVAEGAILGKVYTVWSKAQDMISDAGYIGPSEESLKLAWQTGIYKTPAQFKHNVVRDHFVQQRNMWLGFAKETREAFVLNLRQTITRRLENQHSIWQESQMSVDLESGFLDSDPASPEDRCCQTEELEPENTRSPDLSNSLSLSLKDFETGKASPGRRGNIQQDAEGRQKEEGIEEGN
ncbi:hypothetical protein B9Z19DRAFT_1064296 [Tuber borchii]|uniref:Uncharacterized protein n=1 Tax=Tuber borchii TaxID=42251 RepID=A0A2T6ZV79_TUBBO|nr:hypothetical protein B9Z19DRAFT_1064296 [Tuber borchii]